MSSFFGLAEQVLASATGGSDKVRKTGGHEYNTHHHRQQPQDSFNPEEVLSHADAGEEDREYITNAVRHVHDNPRQHHEQVDEGDLSKYGLIIMSALTAVSSKSGFDVGSLPSGAMSEDGGNQLMGLVMKQVGGAMGTGAGGEEKQSFMNGAAMTLTKLVAQKQLSTFIGGSNSGGLGMMEIGKTLLKSRFG